jgi:magnesium transporter
MVEPIKVEDALERVGDLLANDDFDGAADLLRDMHPADSAEIIAELGFDQQAELVKRLETEELADVFEQMHEEDMAEFAQHLDKETLADVLDEMEPDIAADLLNELEPEDAAELIEEMDESASVVPLLKFPAESAGGIMNSPPPSLRRWMKVREAITFLRENYQDAEDIYYLYVLDRNARLIGLVNLRSMILADPEQTIESIMRRDLVSIDVDADQEEAAQLLSRYDLLAVPVVDHENRLVGIITVDDLVDVLEAEATEDMYHMAQMSADTEIYSPIPRSIRNRMPWLIVNLGTAFLAAAVVGMFENTIAQAAVLAALMPIVTGQGGNAGTQSMTVVVRSLALREIEPRDTLSALWHEFRIGVINGLIIGALVALLAILLQRNIALGIVIGLAMFGNMIVAATFGVLVPMTLKKLKVDPALASSIFVTTATDCLGFFLFLGLATYFLPWIK